MSPTVRWVSLFIDTPKPQLDPARRFWEAVTNSRSGEPEGEHGEYLPLVPPDGDGCVWLQETGEGSEPGAHPDFYVDDLAGFVDRATGLGAAVTRNADDLVVFRSPGAMAFCAVQHNGQALRPGPVEWPGGASLLRQLCLDMPAGVHDQERAFWAELTDWQITDAGRPEFSDLVVPPELPIRFLIQRLDDDAGPVRAHLDVSSEARDAETARHQSLGADLVRRTEQWTVLRDPAGREYCITDRSPWSD